MSKIQPGTSTTNPLDLVANGTLAAPKLSTKIQFVGDNPPEPMTGGAAGVDLRAALADPLVIKPLSRAIVGTGLKVQIPLGTELQIRPRSGLALRNGITVLNTPGTVDSDYRGEIKVILYNSSPVEDFTVNPGDRIAQAILASYISQVWEQVETLEGTDRGEGGFGSTGVN